MLDAWRAVRALLTLILAASLMLAGCAPGDTDTAPISTAPTASAQAPDAPPRAALTPQPSPRRSALALVEGLACKPSTSDIRMCTTAAYAISGSDAACADDSASFGAVLADTGVDLREGIDRGDSKAHLAPGQFVCIQFVAEPKTGGDGWSYITAIPPSLVAACAQSNCPTSASPLRWNGNPPPGECDTVNDGGYSPACAAGWVPTASLDTYSMGLASHRTDAR